MPVDPALRLVLEQIAAADAPPFHELTPGQARELYAQMQMPVEDVPLAEVTDTHVPGPAGEVPVRVYKPDTSAPLPTLVFFHGGGWVIGGLDTHDPTCRTLARDAGCAVVSVDYRLAPEHRHPAAAEDCYAVTCFVAEKGAELGLDPSRLAVGGDSAGGNLAAVVALQARDRGGPGLRHQLLVYPVTDADFDRPSYLENADGYLLTRDTMRWFWDHYVPEPAVRESASVVPLRAESLAGLPPALVQTAEFDPLRDEGEAYAARLEEAGVPVTCTRYDGMIHGFFGMAALTQGGRDAVAEAAAALRGALSD